MTTKIEWTDYTWNPIVGCSKCSPGCQNCYAEKMGRRLAAIAANKNLLVINRGIGRYVSVIGVDGKWNGKTVLDIGHDISDEIYKPLRLKKPRRIFVCSMSDLFHENVSDWAIEKVCRVQKEAPWHTYIWLTKRPEQMRDFILDYYGVNGPGKNVWCGVTVCNQDEADRKIPILLQTPASTHFVSIEPMLGEIDLENLPGLMGTGRHLDSLSSAGIEGSSIYGSLKWVIVGGESGHRARPMHPDWVRSVRDQCVSAKVPFFFKQWGDGIFYCKNTAIHTFLLDGMFLRDAGWKAGDKKGGRTIDGKIYDQYPIID